MRLQDQATGRKDMLRFKPSTLVVAEGWNERTSWDGIEELGRAMHRNGQKQPVIIYLDEAHRPVLVDGERRWRASIWIVENLDPKWEILAVPDNPRSTEIDRLFTQIEGNSGVPFTYLEKARVYLRARNLGATQQEIADRTQATKQAVSRALVLVEQGAPDLLSLVQEHKISGTAALKIIDAHPDDHAAQLEAANAAISTANEAGKDHASPKHLPSRPSKPVTLTFEFAPTKPPGEYHPVNTHGVATDPDLCTVGNIPKAWKLERLELLVAFLETTGKWASAYHSGYGGGLPGAGAHDCSTEREAWLQAWEGAVRMSASHFRYNKQDKFAEALEHPETRIPFEAALDAYLSGKGSTETAADATDNSADVNSSASAEKLPSLRRFIITNSPSQARTDGTMYEDNALIMEHPPAGITRFHLLSRDTADFGTAYGYRFNDITRLPDLANAETLGEQLEDGYHAVMNLALDQANIPEDCQALRLLLSQVIDDAMQRYYPMDGTAAEPETIDFTDIGEDLSPADTLPIAFKAYRMAGQPAEPDKEGNRQEDYRFVLTGIPTTCPTEYFHILVAFTDDHYPKMVLGHRYKRMGEAEVEILPNEKSKSPARHIIDNDNRRYGLLGAYEVVLAACLEAKLPTTITGELTTIWGNAADECTTALGAIKDLEVLQWVAKGDRTAIDRIKESGASNRDGTGVGFGNDGGFADPAKRLAQADKILDELADKGKGNERRVTTMEVVLRFIRNETSAADLKAHLTSAD